MVRWVFPLLLLAFIGLQYRFWFGDGSIREMHSLDERIAQQQIQNEQARQRNLNLSREVMALKSDSASVEALARQDLGLVREGETFFMITND